MPDTDKQEQIFVSSKASAAAQAPRLTYPAVDTTIPIVSAYSPLDNAINVAVNSNLTLTFSESVTAVSGKNIVIKKAADNSVLETIAADDAKVIISGATVTINPTAVLAHSTGYYVQIDPGAFKDAANNDYAGIADTTTWSFTTAAAPDTTAPTVTAYSPLDDAINVAVNANLTLTFIENVTAVSGKNIVIKKAADNSVLETIAADDAKVTISGATVTINPTVVLAHSTGYYVQIDPGAFKDAANNDYSGIADMTTWSFTTAAAPDTTAPTVTAYSPLDDATDVAVNTNLTLTFSESVTAASGKNIVIKKASDNSIVETILVTDTSRVTVTGVTYTINPAADLAYSTGYYVQIDPGAFKDAANNNYAGIADMTTWSFTTVADTTAPTVVAYSPLDNATNVVVNSNLSLTFSESVTAVSGKNIVIKKASDNSVLETIAADDAKVIISGVTVTINPTAVLAHSTGFYVQIDPGAFKDAANNDYSGIADTTTWSFTTAAAPDTTAPTVTAFSPLDDAINVAVDANLTLIFSENVTASSGKNIVIKKASDNSVVETIAANDAKVTISGTTVTINPAADLAHSTGYYVQIDSGAFKDAASNNYAGIADMTTWSFMTTVAPDTTAPTVTAYSPLDDAINVAVNANLTLTFIESVTAVSGKNIVIKKAADNSVLETIAADDAKVTISGATVTINPTVVLAHSTGYYVQIEAGAFKDAANNDYAGIADTTTWSFTTAAEPDTTAPTVIAYSPLDDAINVAVNANLTLTFSENVTAASGKNIVIKKAADNSIVETIAANDATKVTVSDVTVTINPVADLTYSTGYYVQIDPGAFADAANNNYAGIVDTTTWSFTTAAALDATAPTVTAYSPVDDATNVAVNANLTLTFSENVTAASGKNIVIKKASDNSIVETIAANDTTKVTVSGTTVTINPAADLTYSTGYYVQIDAGAFADAANNNFAGIADTTTWSFTTTASPLTAPLAPAHLTALAGDAQVALSWGSVQAANYYTIYYGTTPGLYGGTPLATVTGTTYEALNLINGAAYYFAIKAGNAAGSSPYSNEVAATPQATVPPALTTVHISSSNPVSGLAKPGDSVTLTFTANKALNSLTTASIAGRAATVTSVGDSVYRAAYTFTGSESEGIVAFTIDYADMAGIAGPRVTATTDMSRVLFDKTAPSGTLRINGGAASTGETSVVMTVTASDGSGSGNIRVRFSNDSVVWSPWETFTGTKVWQLTSGLGRKTVYMELRDKAGNVTPHAVTAVIELLDLSSPSSGGGGDSDNNSNSGPPSPPNPQNPQKETITVDVENKGSGSGAIVSTAVINRTTDADGRKTDEVTLTPEQAALTVKQLESAGSQSARMVIPDPKDEVAELNVKIPQASTSVLANGNVGLEIFTNNVRIDIPGSSLQGMKEDVYFRIVPVKEEDERKEIEQRAKTEQAVRIAAGSGSAQVVGHPMTIETNLQSRPVTLVLPLESADYTEQQQRDMGVFIEHSDGTKEFVKGEIVPYDDTGKLGIRFAIAKFSTFTIVHMEGWGASTAERALHKAYITGYSDGTFGPERSITRAEMAAILARTVDKASDEAKGIAYNDVPSGYWAKEFIDKAAKTGLMQGYPDASFRPDQTITRAEMAAIAAKLRHDVQSLNSDFTDTNGHWAQTAISRAKSAGIIDGFPDATFRPEQPLTRAEAVTIINRLLGRGPLSGTDAKWPDVPERHWAYEHIQEASVDHAFVTKPGGEQKLTAP
ncbi:Ig-like domain-containing protein [Paenibacillus mesophilus]|uniref:Ig-like domain-containing protein n=1 Tax=Paenibacillus mesophilus TaxID=2582849 RepID=UPI0013051D04|nr:Ig-like domain-containing protein [Paenibacillus mesophilus]